MEKCLGDGLIGLFGTLITIRQMKEKDVKNF